MYCILIKYLNKKLNNELIKGVGNKYRIILISDYQ